MKKIESNGKNMLLNINLTITISNNNVNYYPELWYNIFNVPTLEGITGRIK